ncbi:MAG: hypothetical protein AB7F86_06590 [Bdellovibrionales bacterium]
MRRLIVLLSLLSTPASWAHRGHCQNPLLAVPVETSLRFLTDILPADPSVFGDRWAVENLEFRKWLKQKKIVWKNLATAEKYGAMGRFFSEALGPYVTTDFEAARAEQLAQELRHRGAPIKNLKNGYDILENLSRANVERLWARFAAKVADSSPLDPKTEEAIEQTLQNLSFALIHNTTELDRRPSLSLLSARELVKLGITHILNTKPFNSEILKTDGNVFFFVIPYSRKGNFPVVKSKYGRASLILSESFADQWGWVSPYVMNPPDLVEVAERGFPEALANFPQEGKLEKLTSTQWRPLVRSLSQMDFKLSDFRNLMIVTLRRSLRHLARSNRTEFEKVLLDLTKGDNLFEILEQYSLGQVGFSMKHGFRSLELKVPMAVPPEKLDFRMDSWNEDYPGMGNRRSLPIPKGPMLDRIFSGQWPRDP